MSASGTKRTFYSHGLMSAFGGKADIASRSHNARPQSGHAELHCTCPLMTPCKRMSFTGMGRAGGLAPPMTMVAVQSRLAPSSSLTSAGASCAGSRSKT